MTVPRNGAGRDQGRKRWNRQADLVKKDHRKYQQQSVGLDQMGDFLHFVLLSLY